MTRTQRIAYASDLHLEFGRDLAALLPAALSADVFVLAGDLETDPARLAWHLRRVRQRLTAPIERGPRDFAVLNVSEMGSRVAPEEATCG